MTKITETINQVQNTTNELRMVLRPSTLNMRNDFQNVMNNRIIENNSNITAYPVRRYVYQLSVEKLLLK